MIWRFEGGPWDGKELEVVDTVAAPEYQTVTPVHGDSATYWLAETSVVDTVAVCTYKLRELRLARA